MKPIAYGGSLVRDVSGLPGMLEKFVHISRKYSKSTFQKYHNAIAGTFGHVNEEPLEDEGGNQWPAGSLFSLGCDGYDNGKEVVLVHKFIPVAALYTPTSFAFLAAGSDLQTTPPVQKRRR